MKEILATMLSIKAAFIIAILAIINPVMASPYYISLIDVIVSPEKYVGKCVMFIGYNSHRVVYLTESSAKYGDIANSVSYSDKREGYYDFCEDAFVRITGNVQRDSAGGIFLKDVTSVYSLDERRECEASLKHQYRNPDAKK